MKLQEDFNKIPPFWRFSHLPRITLIRTINLRAQLAALLTFSPYKKALEGKQKNRRRARFKGDVKEGGVRVRGRAGRGMQDACGNIWNSM